MRKTGSEREASAKNIRKCRQRKKSIRSSDIALSPGYIL